MSAVTMPHRRIRALYKQMLEFDKVSSIGLKETGKTNNQRSLDDA